MYLFRSFLSFLTDPLRSNQLDFCILESFFYSFHMYNWVYKLLLVNQIHNTSFLRFVHGIWRSSEHNLPFTTILLPWSLRSCAKFLLFHLTLFSFLCLSYGTQYFYYDDFPTNRSMVPPMHQDSGLHVSLSGPNFSYFLKLTETNYLLWAHQMEPFLIGNNLCSTSTDPSLLQILRHPHMQFGRELINW